MGSLRWRLVGRLPYLALLLDSVRLWTVSRRELGQKFLRDRLEFLFSGALEFLFSGASGLFHASLLLRFGRSKASSNYMNLFFAYCSAS
jgi:hypothetical protein